MGELPACAVLCTRYVRGQFSNLRAILAHYKEVRMIQITASKKAKIKLMHGAIKYLATFER